jgi:6-pyruvoyltetrahydropterin/6-carboxytetrahydropterin synthase
MSRTLATRYHDISCGHRVVGHEGACANLHGHNYRIHFTCSSINLDSVGRVVDFSAIKDLLCKWLEDNWDHRFLVWDGDIMAPALCYLDETVMVLPFNPTAENLARYLVLTVGPVALQGTGAALRSVTIEETRKCSATFSLEM